MLLMHIFTYASVTDQCLQTLLVIMLKGERRRVTNSKDGAFHHVVDL